MKNRTYRYTDNELCKGDTSTSSGTDQGNRAVHQFSDPKRHCCHKAEYGNFQADKERQEKLMDRNSRYIKSTSFISSGAYSVDSDDFFWRADTLECTRIKHLWILDKSRTPYLVDLEPTLESLYEKKMARSKPKEFDARSSIYDYQTGC
jgi:hypothetical protein